MIMNPATDKGGFAAGVTPLVPGAPHADDLH